MPISDLFNIRIAFFTCASPQVAMCFREVYLCTPLFIVEYSITLDVPPSIYHIVHPYQNFKLQIEWRHRDWPNRLYFIHITCISTTLCEKVCQWLATGRRLSPGPPVASTNKTDRHDITEILLKVAINTIKQSNKHNLFHIFLWLWASYTNKTDRHDITEIFLKVALNTINQNYMHFQITHIFKI